MNNKHKVDKGNSNPQTLEPVLNSEELEKMWAQILEKEVAIYEDEDELKEINESESIFKEAQKAYSKVDDNILAFIANFVENQNNAAKQKKKLKGIFFVITMFGFSVVLLTPIALIIAVGILDMNDGYIVITAIISAIVEVLTTIIILPKIVAEYLFNKEEENSNIKIVELMQKYSETMHGYDDKN